MLRYNNSKEAPSFLGDSRSGSRGQRRTGNVCDQEGNCYLLLRTNRYTQLVWAVLLKGKKVTAIGKAFWTQWVLK